MILDNVIAACSRDRARRRCARASRALPRFGGKGGDRWRGGTPFAFQIIENDVYSRRHDDNNEMELINGTHCSRYFRCYGGLK